VSDALVHSDPDRAKAICETMEEAFDGERAIDVISATHAILCETIAVCSSNLEVALGNVDRLAEDARAFLKMRMGN
jgi:hypothetical protein